MSMDNLNAAAPAVEVEHSPTRVSSILAVVAAFLAVISSGLLSVLALLFGFIGLVGVAAGLFVMESKRAVLISTGLIFVAVLMSGVQGNTPPFLIFSAIATILAFDLGQNAFSVGTQMSDTTRTQRGELVHAAASLIVGVVVAIFAYVIYLVGPGGRPASGLVFILLAAVLLVWAIRT